MDPPWVKLGPNLEPDWFLSRFILVLEWAQLGPIVELYWFLLGSFVDQRWNSFGLILEPLLVSSQIPQGSLMGTLDPTWNPSGSLRIRIGLVAGPKQFFAPTWN